MPAAARAAELATAMWPSVRSRKAGWPAVTASRSWRGGEGFRGPLGVVPAAAEDPLCRARRWRRRSLMRCCISASEGVPSRSTVSFCWPAEAMWVWASLKPGMAKAPWRSMTLVCGAFELRMSASVPTAMMVPLVMAMAVTRAGVAEVSSGAEVGAGEDVAVEEDGVGADCVARAARGERWRHGSEREGSRGEYSAEERSGIKRVRPS